MADDHEQCSRCHGTGRVRKHRATMDVASADEAFVNKAQVALAGAAATDADFVFVLGASTIYEACREASERARERGKNVAFDFNGLLVVVTPTDDPDQVGNGWWQRMYGRLRPPTYAESR